MSKKSIVIFLFFLISISISNPIKAEEAVKKTDKKSIEAVRLSSPPKIDGVLDDVWKTGAIVSDPFYQWTPKEGAPSTEKTIVYIGYDDKNLYVAFRAFDSEPDKIWAHLATRDSINKDDIVWISLDTFNDQRLAYEFICNPLGIQWDVFMTPDVWDATFDTVWKSAGKLTGDGYIVEMAIPFKSLRFPKTEVQDWGFQIHRNVKRRDEHSSWSPFYEDRGRYFYQMGTLKGLKNITPSTNIEAIPEMTAYKNKGKDVKGDIGLNLRASPSPNFSLDAAINPDFSQIELDPIRVLTNLRFPVLIAEKRPFFLERADLFNTPINTVHTRTIVNPLWGAKATGKIGKTNFGTIFARDEAKTNESTFALGRLNMDVGNNNTLGAMYTDREKSENYYNRVAGLDTKIRFNEIYYISAQGLYSFTDSDSIQNKEGQALYAKFSREAREFIGSLTYEDITPDFQSDAGFIPRTNYRKGQINLQHKNYVEKRYLTSWGPSAVYYRIYSNGGTLTDEYKEFKLSASASNWSGGIAVLPNNLERFNDTDFYIDKIKFDATFSPSKYYNGSTYVTFGEGIHYSSPIEKGDFYSIEFYLTLKPTSFIQLESSIIKSNLSEKGSSQTLSDQETFRETARVQMTKYLSTRIIGDYTKIKTPTDTTKTITGSGLLAYVLHPGTAFYLGYDFTREKTDTSRWSTTNETIFTKLTYRFRY
jgi:Carbohydrate family 9 binding domain-like/Domain of unknown function (DUF5916)